MTTIINTILAVIIGFFIIQALPAAIDQNLESYRADKGINRAEVLSRWQRP